MLKHLYLARRLLMWTVVCDDPKFGSISPYFHVLRQKYKIKYHQGFEPRTFRMTAGWQRQQSPLPG